jgi:hypothetical protein
LLYNPFTTSVIYFLDYVIFRVQDDDGLMLLYLSFIFWQFNYCLLFGFTVF